MQGREHNNSGLELAWTLWRRRKWLAIVMFAMAFSSVVTGVMALPDLYRATAAVLVEEDMARESFLKPAGDGELKTRLHAVSQQILSRLRLQDLVARFDLYPELRKRAPSEAAVERMRRDIQLDVKEIEQGWGRRATVAFSLSYQGWDPEKVAQVANTLASFFVAENERVRERQAAQTTKFLKEQFAGVENKLREQEQRIGQFKERYMGELPEQQVANLATLGRLNEHLRLNNANQLRALERRERLLEDLSKAGPLASRIGPDGTASRLGELKRKLAELRTRYTDRYPDVARTKAEIRALERQQKRMGDARVQVPSSPVYGKVFKQVETELEALKGEETQLREAIALYQRRVENAPKWDQSLQNLRREYDAGKEVYSSLLRRYEDAQLAEMVVRQKNEQFRILNPAIPPKMPADPNRIRLMLMGLVLSLGVAAGVVILAEQLDTSFHTVDDLHVFTSLPVLASIPRIITQGDIWHQRLRLYAVTLALGLGLALLVKAAYFFGHDNQQLVWMLTQRGS